MRQRFADAVALPPLTAVKLLDQVRERVRYLHYSIRTEDAYVYWIRGFWQVNHMLPVMRVFGWL